jgi:hypothetical protein
MFFISFCHPLKISEICLAKSKRSAIQNGGCLPPKVAEVCHAKWRKWQNGGSASLKMSKHAGGEKRREN